jgi:predicted dithiol-disulfide oxidoreductase (DUF899 family)
MAARGNILPLRGSNGALCLADLFEGCSQLIVYHSCSALTGRRAASPAPSGADNFNGIAVHLRHRDVTLAAVSRAPLARINAYKQRMGWSFPWVSSEGSDFNFDHRVSFASDEIAKGEAYYNYKVQPITASDEQGISVFYKNARGEVFHTYSCHG